MKSNCHNAPMSVSYGNEGTNFYYCTICTNPCDPVADMENEPLYEKIFFVFFMPVFGFILALLMPFILIGAMIFHGFMEIVKVYNKRRDKLSETDQTTEA